MTDERNTPDQADGDPSQRFADIQAEIEGIDLAVEYAPGADPSVYVPSAADAVVTAPIGVPRLCPGCNGVHEFVDGRCLNCGYQLGPQTPHGAEAVYMVGEARSPLLKVTLVLLALVLLGIAGWFVWPLLSNEERKSTDAASDVAGAKADAEADAEAEAVADSSPALTAVTVDDALRARIVVAIRAGNDAWQDQGVKAYVYRYNVRDHTGADLRQQLSIIGYTGGADARVASSDPKDDLFYTAVQSLLEEINANSGVTATMDLRVGSEEGFAPGDTYVLFGRDYGADHMEDIQTVIDSVENYKNTEGQYPLALDGTVIQSIRTKGNPNFMPNGYGYLPLFRADGSGNIVMGTGAGVAKLKPAEVSGYYIFAFLAKPIEGLDVYSPADLGYYTQKISPFPYKPNGYVKNMPLTKDGKPDGIGAVVKNGKLQ